MRQIVFFAPLAFLVGCGTSPSPSEATRAQSSAVLGGAPDTTTSSVIAVFANLPTGPEMCSGFLIAPDLVLTARHCVAPVENPKGACGAPDGGSSRGGAPLATKDVWISPDAVIKETSPTARVKEVIIEAGSTGGALCGADVALIRLVVPLKSVTPLPVRVSGPPVQGESFTAVGYGVWNVDQQDDSGTRRIVTGLSVESASASDRTAEGEWIADRGPCAGDSGSPAIATDGSVIGVMSRGSKATCAHMIYESVDTHADWLREQVKISSAALGIEPPDWVTGKTPDASAEAPTAAPAEQTAPPSAAPPASNGCAIGPPRAGGASGALAIAAIASARLFTRRRTKRNLPA
jgi:hypothetical protein